MAEEEYKLVPYKDILELKSELDGPKKGKEVSLKDLSDTMQKLAKTINDMLEIFGAAAEQMNLEEKELESNTKKHEQIMQKLDKLIDQNRTIADGMVAIVEMVKEKKIAEPVKEKIWEEVREEPKPRIFSRPQIQRWQPGQMRVQQMAPPQSMQMQPAPMPMQNPAAQPQPVPVMPAQALPASDLGMPPMEPSAPDFDFPEDFNLEEEPKKKGLLGMFKK